MLDAQDAVEVQEPDAPGTAVAVIIRAQLPTVIAADKDDLLGKLAEKLRSLKLDASTNKGREQIKTAAADVRRTKAALLRLADEVSEEARATHKKIVAEKHTIEERLDALWESVRAPLTAYEQAEKDRVAGHEAAIERIKAAAHVPPGAASYQIRSLIDSWDVSDILNRDWKEFSARAAEAATNTTNALKAAHADAVQREEREAEEKRQAEIEAQRRRDEDARLQAEREARIAAEAAERAQREADERAAREAAELAAKVEAERLAAERREREAMEAAERAQQAAARAEADRIAAEQRAAEVAAQAERDRIAAEERAAEAARQEQRNREAAEAAAEQRRLESVAAERKRIEEQNAEIRRQAEAEAERHRQAEAARIADKEHRSKVNRDVVSALMKAATISSDDAKAIVVAIAKGTIVNVTINY